MAGVRETRKKETRQAILEAAIRLFSEQGYEKTSIAAIARAAGVGKGTIYGYFGAKDEIFLAFCEDEIEYAFNKVADENDPDAPLIDQLMTLFMSQFEMITANREFGRLLERELIFPNEATSEKSRTLGLQYQRRLGEILTRAIGRGDLKDESDLLLVMAHFYGLYVMVLHIWFSGGISSKEDAELILRAFLLQALGGLGKEMALSGGDQALLDRLKQQWKEAGLT